MSAPMPSGVAICAVSEVAEGQRKLVFVEGRSVVVFRIEGQWRAIENSCPHNGASLAGGRLDGAVLSCPAHGLRFDLRTGRAVGGGHLCLGLLPTQVIDGQLVLTNVAAE
ncbi:Rieske (2Fe-2S) protein [Paraburkholderia sp. J67]|uniref:Rieske (2Fe-2S) protein n=1 Tax=Paraburkholderia sp. J67 TaxID=2805435 RepID=UPI002ABDC891|nr:Rieske 2Fe-2S domain-containing protein [Paraburkholderia sp. J67]